jgi:predicted acyl esterase
MASAAEVELITRPGVDPNSAPNKPPLPPRDYVRLEDGGLTIERNLSIRLRDGVRILIDLYRPAGSRGEIDLPVLLSWSPYGKHARSNQVFWPAAGVNPDWLSPLTPFEGPDPVAWGQLGYAIAVVDPRGAWLSEGDFHHNGLIEGEDCCDVIQWLANQSGPTARWG